MLLRTIIYTRLSLISPSLEAMLFLSELLEERLSLEGIILLSGYSNYHDYSATPTTTDALLSCESSSRRRRWLYGILLLLPLAFDIGTRAHRKAPPLL